MNYELLLLDFGGVCLLSPVELHHVAETKLGLTPGIFTWMGPVDPHTDSLWQEMTAGSTLREREYWRRRAADVGEAAGITMSLEEYMDLLYAPPSDDLIRDGCKRVVDQAFEAGFSVSVLTNDLRAFHGPEWENGIGVLGQVDHIVDCSDTGVLKPDPRAFQRALDITGFEAPQVLFIDDQMLSTQGAEDFGIEAMWFDIAKPDQSWSAVANRLGL